MISTYITPIDPKNQHEMSQAAIDRYLDNATKKHSKSRYIDGMLMAYKIMAEQFNDNELVKKKIDDHVNFLNSWNSI